MSQTVYSYEEVYNSTLEYFNGDELAAKVFIKDKKRGDKVVCFRTSGIYCIKNIFNNKKYIGGSRNIYIRIRDHINKLINNSHRNCHLQNSFNTYGLNAFTFFIVEKCNYKKIEKNEQKWIDFFDTTDRNLGYNIRPTSDNRILSEETKLKISVANKGRKFSKEHIYNLSKSHIGVSFSKKHKLNHKKAMSLLFKLKNPETFRCLMCEKIFKSKGHNKPICCSEICLQRHYRKIGKYNIDRKCIVCGRVFITNRYRNSKICSNQCIGIYRRK